MDTLAQAACMHCHGTKCPLLTVFFYLPFFFSLLLRLLLFPQRVIVNRKNLGYPPVPRGVDFLDFFQTKWKCIESSDMARKFGFRNFRYHFWWDGGTSECSSIYSRWARTPISVSWNFSSRSWVDGGSTNYFVIFPNPERLSLAVTIYSMSIIRSPSW